MKGISLIAALTLLIAPQALAQQRVIPLYDGPAPGSESWTWPEAFSDNNEWGSKLVYNVSKPTLTVFAPPAGKSNGTAVVICPGGAFVALAIDHEGTLVAKWLADKGVTCFVLKYRLMRSFTTNPFREHPVSEIQSPEMVAVIEMGVADGRAAIQFVRKHSAEFNIEPNRVGIMGFSAGGTVAAATLFDYSTENRPDFAAPVYAYFPLAMRRAVPNDAPPVFITVASDDGFALAPHSVDLYSQWLSNKHDAELHVYAKGGHGFGMRAQNLPTDKWIDRFGEWLGMQGLLKPQKK